MRWPPQSAITRRDEHLAATRRLSMWIAGGAAAASVALAAALGLALPGHAATSAAQQSTSTGRHAGRATPAQSAHHRRGLAPPQQAPVNSGAPPTVSSGGS